MPQTDLDGVDGVFDQFIKCAILKIPKKKPSMACLINLLNNGVNGVDSFVGFIGVFDNLPKSRLFLYDECILDVRKL